jgi:hypothetical protein
MDFATPMFMGATLTFLERSGLRQAKLRSSEGWCLAGVELSAQAIDL